MSVRNIYTGKCIGGPLAGLMLTDSVSVVDVNQDLVDFMRAEWDADYPFPVQLMNKRVEQGAYAFNDGAFQWLTEIPIWDNQRGAWAVASETETGL